MPLERIALWIVIALFAAWAIGWLAFSVAAGPVGVVPLVVLGVVGFFLWRLIGERARNAEDDYYENRFDK